MRSSIAAALVLGLSLAAAHDASAGPAPLAGTEPAALEEGHAAVAPVLESFPVEGTGIRRIRATIVMDAPIDRVRSVVFDYDRYPEFMSIYDKAHVVWTTPAGLRLVQMQLGGIVHLWMRVEISPPVHDGNVERYEGRLVQGNVKAFEPRWAFEPMGDRTRVTVESFMDPDLPLVPDGLVNNGARDGVRDAMVALKARVEGRTASR
jgi:ribosome-associated toxin RatA of RatAB toxin-antitoxin module